MYRKFPRQLSLILIGCLCLLTSCESGQQIFKQRLLQFGTIIDLTLVHNDPALAEQAFVDIENKLKLFETYWHAWQESDLHRFNQSIGKQSSIPIPGSIYELIKLSKQYQISSQQLFNPAIGKLISAYGFHGDASPDQDLIDEIIKDIPTMQDLVVRNRHATSINPHLKLDFGGIAKGYAMDKIATDLKNLGIRNFLINAGGDVLTSGQRINQPWLVAIQDPFAPGAIATIQLSGDHSLFTSGNYQRFYLKNEEIVHHIIDPRSGKPSNHISSATVLASDATLADVAATTLMIDGWNNHPSLSKSLGVEDYLIVNESSQIIASRTMSLKVEFPGDVNKVEIY